MDRFKNIAASARSRIPGQEQKTSYSGYSDSRSSTPSLEKKNSEGTLGKLRGYVPDRVTGIVKQASGQSTESEERAARPVSVLVDPSTFAPPPKHRAAYGDEVAAASVAISPTSTGGRAVPPPPARSPLSPPPATTRATPPLPQRKTSSISSVEAVGSRPPPMPPRLPPRTNTGSSGGSFPEAREVTHEDLRERGGLSEAASGAMGRLRGLGVSVPGLETKVPPPPSRHSIASPPPPVSSSSRPSFANRFSTGNAAEVPAQGTTFEEKKAAINTANKFYTDPSKVSFSDMKSAMGTARNFQQRHGEQIAEGARKTQEFQREHGDKISAGAQQLGAMSGHGRNESATPKSFLRSFQQISEASPSPARETIPPPQHTQGRAPPPLPVKKKPPPPPKKKLDGLPLSSPVVNGPPPIPAATRPPPVPRSSRPVSTFSNPHATTLPFPGTSLPNSGLPASVIPLIPSDLDLALHTPWFASSPPRLPQSIQGNPNKAYALSTSWSRSPSGRTKHTLILAILWTLNLSSTKIKITWDGASPESTVTTEQRHFPPPQSVARDELLAHADDCWGVVQWAEARFGQTVGDGECWTLASEALAAAPRLMQSKQTVHGACIFSHFDATAPADEVDGVDIRAGDIMQFWKATWRLPGGGVKMAGAPDHTAVVIGARREKEGWWEVQCLEQNVGGVKKVQRGDYQIGLGSGMEAGGVRVFRPVREGWAEVAPEWDE